MKTRILMIALALGGIFAAQQAVAKTPHTFAANHKQHHSNKKHMKKAEATPAPKPVQA